MAFYPALGVGIFWIALIIGIVAFVKYRKLYTVFYILSVALYIFTAGFVVDVFEFAEAGIMGTLAFSAVIFMVLGFYLSKVFTEHPAQ